MNKNILLEKIKQEYLSKQEIVLIAKSLGLKTNGLKLEIKNNIVSYLETGKVIEYNKKAISQKIDNEEYNIDNIIPKGFKWSYKNRDFYKKHLGDKFKPFYRFQLYIRENNNLTFKQSFKEYKRLLEIEKNTKQPILPQFEYMQYTRDFFEDKINKNRTKQECIKCWKYKKQLKSKSNKYERSDLKILD
jgi:hypothetical protein